MYHLHSASNVVKHRFLGLVRLYVSGEQILVYFHRCSASRKAFNSLIKVFRHSMIDCLIKSTTNNSTKTIRYHLKLALKRTKNNQEKIRDTACRSVCVCKCNLHTQTLRQAVYPSLHVLFLLPFLYFFEKSFLCLNFFLRSNIPKSCR